MKILIKMTGYLMAGLIVINLFGGVVDAKDRSDTDNLINLKKKVEKINTIKNISKTGSIQDSLEISKKLNFKMEIEKKKKKNCKKKHLHKSTYHNKSNLKLVFRKVLPPGLKRSKDSVVFEFVDYEEEKKCRCICRIG